MRYRHDNLHGLIVVDKPEGVSSMDVVRSVRRAAGHCRTGHAGTLDPLATGVLVCCLGRATRAVAHVMGLTKTYETAVDLSALSATDDREGPLEPVPVDGPPSRARVANALAGLEGWIEQTPPSHSAVKVGGRRAYKLARRGETVAMPSRRVRIDAIELLRYAWPLLELRITCGRGTYIRSLARQIGSALGTGGHLRCLRRTAIGSYDLGLAVPLEAIPVPLLQEHLLPIPTPGGDRR